MSGSNGKVEDAAITEMRDGFNKLRGRLFGAIEVTGMPEQQQAAFKGLVRQLTYDAQADIESTLRGR